MKNRSTVWVAICFVLLIATAAFAFYNQTVSGGPAGQSSGCSLPGSASGSPSNIPSGSSQSGYSGGPSGSTTVQPSVQMRAVWIATTLNTDFPSKPGLDAATQKNELEAILDNVRALGLNTVMLQVRGDADALYRSAYFPWSAVLTGTQGRDPGYDPLAFCVQAAHARGLRLMAWINPYRIQRKADAAKLAPQNPAVLNPGWVLKGGDGGLYFNPGVPQVNRLVMDGVREISENYDVDGIVFDDYFYPNTTYDDSAAYRQYGSGLPLDEWRRGNINALISGVHAVAREKGRVFGVSPSGVWANKSANPLGSNTSAGLQSYFNLYADSRLWVQKGYVDFICPQIYWYRGYAQADYSTLLSWWDGVVRGTGVKLCVSHAVYKAGTKGFGADEYIGQLQDAAALPEYGGSAFYGYAQLRADTAGVAKSLESYYRH